MGNMVNIFANRIWVSADLNMLHSVGHLSPWIFNFFSDALFHARDKWQILKLNKKKLFLQILVQG